MSRLFLYFFLTFYNSVVYNIKRKWKKLNKRVKELRKVLDLSQTEFADKLQITQAGLSKIEFGGSILTERNIKTICEKFNVNEDYLRYGNKPIFNNDYSNMGIEDRLKQLRKDILKLCQEEFAKKLDISRANISSIEIGRVALTKRNIKTICEKFNVNEDWLRNGNEPIFIEDDKDNYINELIKKYNINSDEINIIKRLANLDENSRNKIINFIFEIVKENIDKIDENKILQFSNITQDKTKIVARGKDITYEYKSKIDNIIEKSEELNLDDIDFL